MEESAATDSKNGEKIFRNKCSHCHSIEKNEGHKYGPNLYGVMGRIAGSLPDYSYSAAHKAKGVEWNEKTLDEYILNPVAYIKGTKKKISGMKDPHERADLITYLKEASKAE